MTGRLTIALYNNYDPVKFAEAHRRALARAAPIALAFDCNLATFGFPYERELRTPVDVAKWVADSTTIGEGGKYFIELTEKGRFSNFPFPDKGLPPQLGEVIVTTRKPDERKSVDARWVAEGMLCGKSLCLLFGLGPHGLERKWFDAAPHHLDITGKRYSLETCTAIGAVPSVIHAYMDALSYLSTNKQYPKR
ncbi:MAG: DUF531 domain-containing protein [Thermoplasmata archaeon HGW-Thermoplasmata-2]|nr:MAG: DUF531 domain-containing protein [Thermoplasmata archaeon HGW-Thermoplasmata-2]